MSRADDTIAGVLRAQEAASAMGDNVNNQFGGAETSYNQVSVTSLLISVRAQLDYVTTRYKNEVQ